jgi:superfamily II DNA or RNA helicase
MKQTELNESAKKQVIIGTFALAQEGLDIPELDTIILTTPHSDVKQAVGRILRETKGKTNNPVIYDIVDHWSILTNMYNKRCAMYREAGFLPALPPPVCPFKADP